MKGSQMIDEKNINYQYSCIKIKTEDLWFFSDHVFIKIRDQYLPYLETFHTLVNSFRLWAYDDFIFKINMRYIEEKKDSEV
jgi:hypothetical protein